MITLIPKMMGHSQIVKISSLSRNGAYALIEDKSIALFDLDCMECPHALLKAFQPGESVSFTIKKHGFKHESLVSISAIAPFPKWPLSPMASIGFGQLRSHLEAVDTSYSIAYERCTDLLEIAGHKGTNLFKVKAARKAFFPYFELEFFNFDPVSQAPLKTFNSTLYQPPYYGSVIEVSGFKEFKLPAISNFFEISDIVLTITKLDEQDASQISDNTNGIDRLYLGMKKAQNHIAEHCFELYAVSVLISVFDISASSLAEKAESYTNYLLNSGYAVTRQGLRLQECLISMMPGQGWLNKNPLYTDYNDALTLLNSFLEISQ